MIIDEVRFAEAVNQAVYDFREQGGIGTLGEKTLHRAMKYYVESDPGKHEVKYLGCVADVMNEGGITEIQTRSFERLVPKLQRFLSETAVRVVYPIIREKTIIRVDTSNGETANPRKSPRKGSFSDAAAELFKIKEFIGHPNLSVTVVLIDAVETRRLYGSSKVGRKRTVKIDSIPTNICSALTIDSPSDCSRLLPIGLSDGFTAKEFASVYGARGAAASFALKFLLDTGALTRRKEGKSPYVYYLQRD